MKNVWNFINSKLFLYLILIIISLLILKKCNGKDDSEFKISILEQNNRALSDSISFYRSENGALNFSISGYISDINNLKHTNKELYDISKRQKGEILSLNNTNIILKQEIKDLMDALDKERSEQGDIIRINDSTYVAPWKLHYDWKNGNYDIFHGETFILVGDSSNLTHKETFLTRRESSVNLIFGQRVENGNLRVFVESDYPGLTTSSLQGVLIDPNSSKYIKGLINKKQYFPNTRSVGIGFSVGYNVLELKPYVGVGININYNLYQW